MVGKGLPSKHDVARGLLLKGTLFVHLDPRSDQVMVPPCFKRQPQLVLQIGLDMPVSIPDLRVDDIGVFGTLSFHREPFTCSVPWESVFALVGDDGRGMVWPGSMPREIAAEIEREARPRSPSAPPTPLSERSPEIPPPASRGHTARAFGSAQAAPSADASLRDTHKRAKFRSGQDLPPYLRVVK
jgi:hypothetical protein